VRNLSEIDPAVDLLDGLTVLTHRAGILKSFLECNNEGWLQAGIAGLTNTFRFKHYRPLVNLPSVDKPYGDVIRGCLTCPEGYVLAGADMTSLEDTTKRHYMKPLDPDYVEEMTRDGFDPHLDLALHAGVINQDDIDKHNSGERSLKALRKNYKVVNYSATYGVGAPKLSRETGMSKKEAKTLLEAFWSRNWAIEKVAKDLQTRELFNSTWLKNPVSGFWYSLRSDKDRFSTLNQGTGVFCFDTWVSLCRSKGIKSIGQFHDEVIALVKKGEEGAVEKIMHDAAIKLNERVQLNVPLGTDVQFGNTYADIH
jgi:DNA polymerase I-like protein with 3'-5' exonuclease and polymerase domains|tara:strand:- start:2082 stop:3014 length:933 start_codon:yes stop_codon:yes gene_type:complete